MRPAGRKRVCWRTPIPYDHTSPEYERSERERSERSKRSDFSLRLQHSLQHSLQLARLTTL
jgi:hypothetical protein